MRSIGCDACGPFHATERNNKHIVNFICLFSKYVVSVCVEDLKSTTLARAFLNNVALVYGMPTELLTDNAKTFTSEFFKEVCKLLFVDKTTSTPYWSQGNGTCERSFSTFQAILSKYVDSDHADFDLLLPGVTFCYNTAVHRTTNESPYFLMFGRDPCFAIDQILDPRVRVRALETDVGTYRAQLLTSLHHAWKCASDEYAKEVNKYKEEYDRKMSSKGRTPSRLREKKPNAPRGKGRGAKNRTESPEMPVHEEEFYQEPQADSAQSEGDNNLIEQVESQMVADADTQRIDSTSDNEQSQLNLEIDPQVMNALVQAVYEHGIDQVMESINLYPEQEESNDEQEKHKDFESVDNPMENILQSMGTIQEEQVESEEPKTPYANFGREKATMVPENNELNIQTQEIEVQKTPNEEHPEMEVEVVEEPTSVRSDTSEKIDRVLDMDELRNIAENVGMRTTPTVQYSLEAMARSMGMKILQSQYPHLFTNQPPPPPMPFPCWAMPPTPIGQTQTMDTIGSLVETSEGSIRFNAPIPQAPKRQGQDQARMPRPDIPMKPTPSSSRGAMRGPPSYGYSRGGQSYPDRPFTSELKTKLMSKTYTNKNYANGGENSNYNSYVFPKKQSGVSSLKRSGPPRSTNTFSKRQNVDPNLSYYKNDKHMSYYNSVKENSRDNYESYYEPEIVLQQPKLYMTSNYSPDPRIIDAVLVVSNENLPICVKITKKTIIDGRNEYNLDDLKQCTMIELISYDHVYVNGNQTPFQPGDGSIYDAIVNYKLRPNAEAREIRIIERKAVVMQEFGFIANNTTRTYGKKANAQGREKKLEIHVITPEGARELVFLTAKTHQIVWNIGESPKPGDLVYCEIVRIPENYIIGHNYILPETYVSELPDHEIVATEKGRPIINYIRNANYSDVEISTRLFGEEPVEVHEALSNWKLFKEVLVSSTAFVRYKKITTDRIGSTDGTAELLEDKRIKVIVDPLKKEIENISKYLQARSQLMKAGAIIQLAVAQRHASAVGDDPRTVFNCWVEEVELINQEVNSVILKPIFKKKLPKQENAKITKVSSLTENTKNQDEDPDMINALEIDLTGMSDLEYKTYWFNSYGTYRVKIQADSIKTGYEGRINTLQRLTPDMLRNEACAASFMAVMGLVPDSPKPSRIGVRPKPKKIEFSEDMMHKNTLRILENEDLNERQKMVVATAEKSENAVILNQAGPGTGKTKTIGAVIKMKEYKNPKTRFVLTANSNGAIDALAISVCKNAPRRQNDMLVIQSHSALLEEHSTGAIPEWEDYKLLKHAKLLLDESRDCKLPVALKAYENETLKKYVKEREENPLAMLAEYQIIKLVLYYRKIKILVATQAKIEEYRKIIAPLLFDILIVDEGSTCAESLMISLLINLRHKGKTPQLIISGDIYQLSCYLPPSAEILRNIGHGSAIRKIHERGSAPEISLNIQYRCHPAIMDCYNRAWPEPFEAGVTADDRDLLTRSTFPLPNKKCPIVMVDSPITNKNAEKHYMVNEEQEKLVIKTIIGLKENVGRQCTIAVICYYAATALTIKKKLEGNKESNDNITIMDLEMESMLGYLKDDVEQGKIDTSTVDSFIGKQVDVAIVVTTRTKSDKVDEDLNKFGHILDNPRTRVALSRALHGLIIFGDRKLLTAESTSVWGLFLERLFIIAQNDLKHTEDNC
uniref:Integrase catalytic domain-containing protein n=1 Tax=Acrobeloides nanus TaxID=290746 RepID=A0A914ED84_9BILA